MTSQYEKGPVNCLISTASHCHKFYLTIHESKVVNIVGVGPRTIRFLPRMAFDSLKLPFDASQYTKSTRLNMFTSYVP